MFDADLHPVLLGEINDLVLLRIRDQLVAKETLPQPPPLFGRCFNYAGQIFKLSLRAHHARGTSGGGISVGYGIELTQPVGRTGGN